MLNQRAKIEKLAASISDPVSRVTRIYLEEPSFCLGRNRDLEFEIKNLVAGDLGVPYRAIAIAGSAQLGFSPHKNTDFQKGESDLDLAVIDARLFQNLMELCIAETKAFSDLAKFTSRGGTASAQRLQEYISTKALIPVALMPLCDKVLKIEQTLARASKIGRGAFSDVNLAVYMSEFAFCRKQNSGLQLVVSRI